jgi:nucleotide-binding universal stress UspA family protein
MIKSIVVAYDGSVHAQAARGHAISLARLYDARLIGLYVLDVRVVEMPPFLSSAYVVETAPASTLPVEILAAFREDGDRLLEEFREAVEPSGLRLELRLEEGVPAQTIAEIADGHDLLIMGKRGVHARYGDDLIGSTAEQVVRRAGVPVLLAERDTGPLARLCLLYDGSHGANEALKLTADLATHSSSSLVVLTAASDLEEAGRVQSEARAYLSAFSLSVEYRVFAEEIVLSALDALEEEPADLVILGSHGHSRWRSIILGSTTSELLHRVRLPLLVTA